MSHFTPSRPYVIYEDCADGGPFTVVHFQPGVDVYEALAEYQRYWEIVDDEMNFASLDFAEWLVEGGYAVPASLDLLGFIHMDKPEVVLPRRLGGGG